MATESYGGSALARRGSLAETQLDQQFRSSSTEFPTDDEVIESALDHREFVKEVCVMTIIIDLYVNSKLTKFTPQKSYVFS